MVPPTVTVCDTALRPVLTSTLTESAVSVTPPPSDSENDCTSSEPATPPGPMTTTPVAAATARIVVEPVREGQQVGRVGERVHDRDRDDGLAGGRGGLLDDDVAVEGLAGEDEVDAGGLDPHVPGGGPGVEVDGDRRRERDRRHGEGDGPGEGAVHARGLDGQVGGRTR